MRSSPWLPAALTAALLVVCPTPARAQLFEDVGTRAQGLGGAFVAIADDATLTWWNPAGLATGALFNVLFETGHQMQPEHAVGLDPARRVQTYGFSAAFPSLGISHYRLRVSQIEPTGSTGTLTQDREEAGGEAPRVHSLAFNQFGATIGQSLGRHLVLASTLKLVRGGAASAAVDGTTDPLDVGDDLDLSHQVRFDLDAGAMLAFSRFRAGLSVRNLTRPTFGEGGDLVIIERQARVGLAVMTPQASSSTGFKLAADFDVLAIRTPFGEVRHVATGAELWPVRKRLGVRGGLTANTIGESRLTSSAGVSFAATSSFFVDLARTFGSDGSIRRWSSTLRVTY